MSVDDTVLAELREVHQRFLLIVQDLRPDLHRYCARMAGSFIEGEDLVQDTLVRAYFELSQLRELPALRGWIFRIAHRLAIDHLRRRRYAGVVEDESSRVDPGPDAETRLVADQATQLALAQFAPLPPAQRASVILKDVLDESLEEIASVLEMTVPAVKAALHRGRTRLANARPAEDQPVILPPTAAPVLARYAERFNARDWDAVRAMLIEDVQLDLVAREKRRGIEPVSGYFGNYARRPAVHLTPASWDGREVLLVRDPATAARPRYVIELTVVGDRISALRDFRYVPYLLAGAAHPS